jgi:transposase
MGQTLVPDGLWEIVEPLLPAQRKRPQGGGTRYVDDRAVFTAIVYVRTTGCAWWHLLAAFGGQQRRPRTGGLWTGAARRLIGDLGEELLPGGSPAEPPMRLSSLLHGG